MQHQYKRNQETRLFILARNVTEMEQGRRKICPACKGTGVTVSGSHCYVCGKDNKVSAGKDTPAQVKALRRIKLRFIRLTASLESQGRLKGAFRKVQGHAHSQNETARRQA